MLKLIATLVRWVTNLKKPFQKAKLCRYSYWKLLFLIFSWTVSWLMLSFALLTLITAATVCSYQGQVPLVGLKGSYGLWWTTSSSCPIRSRILKAVTWWLGGLLTNSSCLSKESGLTVIILPPISNMNGIKTTQGTSTKCKIWSMTPSRAKRCSPECRCIGWFWTTCLQSPTSEPTSLVTVEGKWR